MIFVIQNVHGNDSQEDLLTDLEDAISEQRFLSAFDLSMSRENRHQSRIHHRLAELEGTYFNMKIMHLFRIPLL